MTSARQHFGQRVRMWLFFLLLLLLIMRWPAWIANVELNMGVILLSHATASQGVEDSTELVQFEVSREWLQVSLSHGAQASVSHIVHIDAIGSQSSKVLLGYDRCEGQTSRSNMCWYWVGVDAERRGDFVQMAEAWKRAGGAELLLTKCEREAATRRQFQAQLEVCKRLATLRPDSVIAHWTFRPASPSYQGVSDGVNN